jgi:hypothetical protein
MAPMGRGQAGRGSQAQGAGVGDDMTWSSTASNASRPPSTDSCSHVVVAESCTPLHAHPPRPSR